MTDPFAAPEADRAFFRRFLERWDDQIARLAYHETRAMFHPMVAGFGTHADVLRGLDHLEHGQWRNVWPTMRDFTWNADGLIATVSPDGRLAAVLATWTSTGEHEDGTTFERPGRGTILFARERAGDEWKAIHTHISLNPGTPQRSFGRREAP